MRSPIVAGQFYPFGRSTIEHEIDDYMKRAKQAEIAGLKAVIAPHAGYIYSGPTAAFSYSAIPRAFKGTFVLAGPNHTGLGTPLSLSRESWETPLGVARCDNELAEAVQKASRYIAPDESAHRQEHSIEVQLPFLQRRFGDVNFIAICMGDSGLGAASEVARALGEAAKKTGREIMFIASSDFTHYLPAEQAKKKDEEAISLIRKMDAAAFDKLVSAKRLSICGHGPITAAMLYAKAAGAKEGVLLNYSNSGAASGSYGSVVAYSAIASV